MIMDDLHRHLHPLRGEEKDYDPLLERIGDANLVLLGEASHGTHDFYQTRADLTRRLIVDKGFTGFLTHEYSPTAGHDPIAVLGKAIEICDV